MKKHKDILSKFNQDFIKGGILIDSFSYFDKKYKEEIDKIRETVIKEKNISKDDAEKYFELSFSTSSNKL